MYRRRYGESLAIPTAFLKRLQSSQVFEYRIGQFAASW